MLALGEMSRQATCNIGTSEKSLISSAVIANVLDLDSGIRARSDLLSVGLDWVTLVAWLQLGDIALRVLELGLGSRV